MKKLCDCDMHLYDWEIVILGCLIECEYLCIFECECRGGVRIFLEIHSTTQTLKTLTHTHSYEYT
jgi:hypothetical protein